MKFLSSQISLLLLCACAANAQQSIAPPITPVSVQVETVMYVRLKPQTLVNAGASIATQRWSELAAANASLRARLGAPLSIEAAFAVPGLQSRWLSINPNDPIRQLARIVLLRYPGVVDAHLMHTRLNAMAEFDVVFNAQRQYQFSSIAAEPYVDPPAPSADDFWCNNDSSPTCLARNPFAAAGFVPPIGVPPNDLKQTESYGQWGIGKIGAPNAWEKLGADRFDGNPNAGLYGSTNVAVIDFGIARGCDPFYGACNSSTKYHADLDANVRDGLSVGNVLASAQGGANDDVQEDGLEFLESPFARTFLDPTSPRIEGGTVRQLTPPVPPNSYVSSGHGSHVTGIIAARLNNNQGAGVCPSCSVAVYRSGGAGASFSKMLDYAVKNGAQAINMSWKTAVTIPGSGETSAEKSAPSPLDALLNVGGSRDVWMVAAADNNRVEITATQPAANINVIAAGGSDLLDNFWNETTLDSTRCPAEPVGFASQCGSNYPNSANASRFLIAPAARMLSTMYTNWVTSRALTFSGVNPLPYGLAACTPELFPTAADTFAPVFNANYGVCTGTSNVAPQASAFIFATQRTPYNGAPDNLVPLYRLAMQGFCRGKKHVYSSGLIASGTFAVSNLTTVGQKCSPTTNDSADPAVLNARFNLVSIEGFLFANAQPGTVPLKLKYSSAEQSYAVMTPADENRAEFAGYSNPASGEVILGYAYANDTQAGGELDSDTWPSGWELARGMNEQSNDGDCDGVADDAEYSLTGFPVSDPMSPSSTCADRRVAIRRETTPSSDVIRLEMKNFGGSTANNVVFYVAAGSLLTVGSLAAPVPSACVVVPPKFPVPGPSTNYAYRCTFASMAPSATASIAFNVFGLNYGMSANYSVGIESIGSPTPDVAPLNNTAFRSFVF